MDFYEVVEARRTIRDYASALRIPLGDEGEWAREVLRFPKDYLMPCFVAVGRASKDAKTIKQTEYSLSERIHKNVW